MSSVHFAILALFLLAGCGSMDLKKGVKVNVRSDESLPVNVKTQGSEGLPVSLNVEYDKPFPVKIEVPDLPVIALVFAGIVSFAALLIALVALTVSRGIKSGSK